jgi:hypothetical protein
MTRTDSIVDCIHDLVDRAFVLEEQGKSADAALLYKKAEELAAKVREGEEEVYSFT